MGHSEIGVAINTNMHVSYREAECPVKNSRCKRKIITPYFTPFAGVNMPKYAYIMPENENEKGV